MGNGKIVGINGEMIGQTGRFRPEALDLRGAQPLIILVAERDGSLTWLTPAGMTDRNLESIKASFFTWLAEYKKTRGHGSGDSDAGERRIITP